MNSLGETWPRFARCRFCGCTNDDPCVDAITGQTCGDGSYSHGETFIACCSFCSIPDQEPRDPGNPVLAAADAFNHRPPTPLVFDAYGRPWQIDNDNDNDGGGATDGR